MINEVWTKLAFKSSGVISGQGEAMEQICQMAFDNDNSQRIWLWSDVDHIYCGYPYDTKSQGFGGAAIPFRLFDGKEIVLFGPWHVGANDLWKATGVDLRNQYITRGMCSYARTYDSRDGYIYRDVFHFEDVARCGSYNRIRDIARAVADKVERMVFFYMESHGGSVHSSEGREYENNQSKNSSNAA